MMMTTRWMNLFLALAVVTGAAPAAAQSGKSRLEQRLSRLFFWQMSQALDLSTSEEKLMTEILTDLHRRRLLVLDKRAQLHERIHAWAKQSKKEEFKKPSTEALALAKEFQSQIDALTKIDAEEHDKLLKAFGEARLLKFYDERKTVIEQVKSALSESSLSSNK